MTDFKYDHKLGRAVRPGAELCPHAWTEDCPHCMRSEINRLRAEIERLKAGDRVISSNRNSYM